MAKAPPLTSQERQQITDLHADGWSLSRIATELGRSKSTVGKYAREAGLQWTSTRTEVATAAKVQTNREKRATLEGRMLDEAGLLLDQLHEPHVVWDFNKDGIYNEHQHPEPDVQAKRALVAAAKTAVDTAVKLAEVDKASSGAGEARGILGNFGAAILAAYEGLPEQGGTEGQPEPDEPVVDA